MGAFEVLRPNIKDVLYQLEVNTFKDGFLRDNDHAGAPHMPSARLLGSREAAARALRNCVPHVHALRVCAGVGLLVSRLGENGKVTKGPMGLGLRLQDTLRVGAFKVRERTRRGWGAGCASKLLCRRPPQSS